MATSMAATPKFIGPVLPNSKTPAVTPVAATSPPQGAMPPTLNTGTPDMYHAGPSAGTNTPSNTFYMPPPQPQKIATENITPTPVAASSTPQQSQGSYPGQLTTAQIQAEAQARIDKQRAALMNAVTGAKTGAKNTYDYTQGLQKDNRALEDAQLHENSNPFSGGTDYKTAMLSRDRQIADTASSKDYNNTIAGYDAQVANFDTLAPEQQQAAIDELTRIERQYGIDLSSITGKINGQNTMQQNQNNFNNGIAVGGLTGNYTGPVGSQGQGSSAQSLQLQGGQGQQQGVQTLASKSQDFNQNMQTQQFAYQQARDVIKDKQYQQTFDQNVQQQGLDYALKQATLVNQITNDQAQRLIGQQNANTAASSSANANANMNQDNLMNIWKATGLAPDGIPGVPKDIPISQASSAGQASKSLDSTYVNNLQNMDPNKRVDFFANEKANIIKDLGINGYNQLYNMYFDQYGAPKQ